MVEKLRAGPYEIELAPLYAGPLPRLRDGAAEEPVAGVLNEAVANSPEFLDAIRSRGEAGNAMFSVGPPVDEAEGRTLAETWRQQTGEALPPSSIARVGMMGHSRPVAISWDALQSALERLVTLRAAWRPEPGPWLFARPARSESIAPQDYERIKALEEEAAAIDALDLDATVGNESATLIERRRAFLRDCESAGVFDADYGLARDKWLNHWFAHRLLALRQAAGQLRAWDLWQGSTLAESPVCLDYVRLQLWPPGQDGRAWALSGLELLQTGEAGDQGSAEERIGGRMTARIWWRRDLSNPALLAVEAP